MAIDTLRSIKQCIDELLCKLEKLDSYTVQHSRDVAQVAELFAKRLCLEPEVIEKIKQAALLHDIGKMELPQELLKTSKKLTKEKRELIKKHTIYATNILENDYPELSDLVPTIKHHHECWNGSGYPCKLKQNEIPLSAQIISIVDNYNALLGRSYSETMPIHEVCKILLNGAGTQWNPYLVYKFVKFIMSNSTQTTT